MSPLLCCTPSRGPGAAQRVCEYPQGTVTDPAPCMHSLLQALTAETSQLMTLVTPPVLVRSSGWS